MKLRYLILLFGALVLIVSCTASPPALTPPPTQVSTPTPSAKFQLGDLFISSNPAIAGEIASVDIDITNMGEAPGAYIAKLRIDGVKSQEKVVNIAAGATETVSFPLAEDVAGTYIVQIGDLSETLVVIELPVDEPEIPEDVEYDIEHEITFKNEGPGIASKLLLRVALITTQEPYQRVVSTNISPDNYEIIEGEYGNTFAEFEFVGVGIEEEIKVKITYAVEVSRLIYHLGPCEGEIPTRFLEPEQWVESDAEEIMALANQLTKGKLDACQKARAIYNWIGDNITYTDYHSESRGALFALHNSSGDCTEFTDLLIALCRAAGIPARFIDGVCPVDPSEPTQKHNWAEVYLAGTGWVPVDPTWGRFEEKRDQYFAGISPDHIIVSKGRNLNLLEKYHYFFCDYWWEGQETDISYVESWEIQGEMATKPDSLLTSDADYYRLWSAFNNWGVDFNTLYYTYSREGFTNN